MASDFEKLQRKEALDLLAKEATTEELLKLVKAMRDTKLRSYLKMI